MSAEDHTEIPISAIGITNRELAKTLIVNGVIFGEAMNQFEKEFLIGLMEFYHGNQSRISKEQGIHRNTLGRYIIKHKINPKLFRKAQKPRKR